jgi:hypothetical protein
MSAARRTAIRAGWIIAFDGRGHRLLRDGVVVVEGDHILHVGPASRVPSMPPSTPRTASSPPA